MSKLARWFKTSREKEVREKVLRHAELVEETAKYLVDFIVKWIKENEIDEALFTVIHNKEHEADIVRRDVLRILAASTALEPHVRVHLARIVRQIDWVADWCLESARLIIALASVKVSSEIVDSILAMLNEVYSTVKATRDCIKAMFEDPFETLNLCDEVEKLEEKVDDLYQTFRKLFSEKCSEIPTSKALLFFHAIDAIEMMTDKCEDTCDNIREYVVSSA
ncbi:MAG: hypothetical protein DRN04_08570 [Thermoprotei archaeon]|nr:MAG: hypothetical protein DRN04_08570 [Thermoprotei archaeon]